MGGVHRRGAWRVSLFAVLRVVPRLGRPVVGDDAPVACGRDKLFVDYAGDGVPVVIDRLTGERRAAQIFVAVLGASSFTYAQATWTQGLADWISGHVGAFEAIGGVPALLVPDNTKVR